MPIMKCGHAANATYKGKPCCVICFGITPGADEISETSPSLENRKAKCAHCQNMKPSSEELPFFEFKGEGSHHAVEMCTCGYSKTAHEASGYCERGKCFEFTPRGPAEHDSYYCGCQGWD